jgi:flagellar hook-length control protein FliK
MKAQSTPPPCLATKPDTAADANRGDDDVLPQANGFDGLLRRSCARREEVLRPRAVFPPGAEGPTNTIVHAGREVAATPAQAVPLTHSNAPRVYPQSVAVYEVHLPVMECVRADIPQLEVRLHPPDLGPMTLSVSLEDSVLRLCFEASNASAMEALRGGLHTLRGMLAQHGLVLADCSIRLLQKSRQGLAKSHEVHEIDADAEHQENTP